MGQYQITVSNNQYKLDLTGQGGQGIQGDSITDVYFDENNDFIIEISNAAGEVVQLVNLGGATITGNLNEFNTIYLGSKTQAPTLDNSNEALRDGALYFDTTLNALGVYDLGNTTWNYPQIEARDSAAAALASELASKASEDASAASEINSFDSEAAASSSASAAAQSATTAANQAGAAINSAAQAAESESNSATSAAQSASSAAQAAADLASIEQIFDNFDDTYLGAFPSDPTTDNDGNPLKEGAIYYNTTDNSVKWYTGVSWEDPSVSAANSAAAAATSAASAAASASNSALSSVNSNNSALEAGVHSVNAANSAISASNSADAAAQSEANIGNVETNASASADAAAASAQASEASAQDSAASALLSEQAAIIYAIALG